MKFGIGQSVPRTEDPRFLTGRGRYVDDVRWANEAAAQIVYSPHAHARIRAIDTDAARAMPGVLAVLTGADAAADGLGGIVARFMPQDFGGPEGYRPVRHILARDKARHIGDRVALVVAETAAAAADAAERVVVDYEPLDAVTQSADALTKDAPKVHDDASGNVSFLYRVGDAAATDAAIKGAHTVVQASFGHARLSANSMEPRTAVGAYDEDDERYTLYTSTQAPHIVRAELARMVFRVPDSAIRVVAPDVGGGFGLKTTPFPEDALVLWAARRLGRPVRWLSGRAEGLMSDDQGRDQLFEGELAFDAEGRILALRCHAKHNVGAYIVGSGAVPPVHFLRLVQSVYHIPTVDIAVSAVMTHTPPTTPYRGAGRPEAVFAIERLLDDGARKLGIGRDEVRRRNFIAPDAMPYTTHGKFTYDSGEFAVVLDKCLKLADWSGFAARRKAAEAAGRLRGIGLAMYVDDSGNLNERVDLRFDASGGATIIAGTHSHGQGHETAYKQLVADWLSLPEAKLRFVQGDTDRVAVGRGTYASRSMTLGANALRAAADGIIDKGRRLAAHLLEADAKDVEFADGAFRIAGTDRTLTLEQVAQASFRPMGIPAALGIGLEAQGGFGVTQPSFPNGCHVCEVEIDPDTGVAVIERFFVVDDVGVAINPMLVEGQVHGGIAQGVGEALMERVVYDRESGQLLSGSFMDYTMPRADDFPPFVMELHEVPCKSNPVGVKGCGEGGAIGATPAVMSAILDALGPLGVNDVEMPATPARLWATIQAARAAGG